MPGFQRNVALWMFFILAITMPVALGYLWLVISSLNDQMHGFQPVGLWELENWRFLWEPLGNRPMIWPVVFNTLVFAAGTSLLVLVVSAMAGYAISRLNFPGRGGMLASVLILHAFPNISLLVATFYVLLVLGLFNTIIGVVFVMASFMMPLGIWLLKGFFDTVPWDMEMAALVDGASRWRIFWQVALPQIRPGLFALGIFVFLLAWGEFIIPYTFITSNDTWILAIYLETLIGDLENADFGLMAAVGVFYTLPALIVFLLGQRYLLQMYQGGSKG